MRDTALIIGVLVCLISWPEKLSAQATCESQYTDPSILEYCGQTESDCTLRANTTSGNYCDVICQIGGGVCLGAFDDNPNGTCNSSVVPLTCDSDARTSMLCICSRAQVDPCDPNPCTQPPDDECTDAVTLLEYEPIGTCTDLGGGTFSCQYAASNVVDCSSQGLVCRNGDCAADADVPVLSEVALGIVVTVLLGAGLWALRRQGVGGSIT